ncbi:MAG TPA: hypothetical protein VI504_02720 [Candidatus Eisenbacteria bacterium]
MDVRRGSEAGKSFLYRYSIDNLSHTKTPIARILLAVAPGGPMELLNPQRSPWGALLMHVERVQLGDEPALVALAVGGGGERSSQNRLAPIRRALDAGIPPDTGVFVFELRSARPPGRARYAIERYVPLTIPRTPQSEPGVDDLGPSAEPTDIFWREPGCGWIAAPVDTQGPGSALRQRGAPEAIPFSEWSLLLERRAHVVGRLVDAAGRELATIVDTTTAKGVLLVRWPAAGGGSWPAGGTPLRAWFTIDGETVLRQILAR